MVNIIKNIIKFLQNCVTTVSDNEDIARREFILNVLLLTSIFLVFTGFIANVIQDFLNQEYYVLSVVNLMPLSFFVILYILSRKGYTRLSSLLLLIIFFTLASFMAYRWGVDLEMGLLAYVLVIIISGIIISSRAAFFTALLVSITIIIVGVLQRAYIIVADRTWRTEVFWDLPEMLVYSTIFLIIATVSWLSNREIEKSLARARRSEAELKKERDSLEITVEQRTRELKETQAEKMTQLYRFAEFGRLSSGLFHDLINPLTAVSLNIEKVKNAEEVRSHVKSIEEKTGAAPISEVSEYVDKAIAAAKKMENMVTAVRKQLSRQENKTLFSVNEEIAQVLEVLAYKARKSDVTIRFFSRQEIKTYGDSIKFSQIALNLVANAIDAYQEKTNIDSKPVTMSLSREGDVIVFEVKDKGVGISEEDKPKLFEPFFTTKKEGYGLGIGLSIIKRIVEKDYSGSIGVQSKKGEGSTFTVKFPKKENG